MTRYVWIIEIMHENTKKWVPTVGCALTKAEAIIKRNCWQARNPDDLFQVKRYVQQVQP